jgi:hypothetical protein
MHCHVTTRVINHILSEEALAVTKKVEHVLGLMMFRKKTPVTNQPLKVTWDLSSIVEDSGYTADYYDSDSDEDTIEDPEYQDPMFLLGMYIRNL